MNLISPSCQKIYGTYHFTLCCAYKVVQNGMQRSITYLIADGKYATWPIFMVPTHQAEIRKEAVHARKQEGIRKDI